MRTTTTTRPAWCRSCAWRSRRPRSASSTTRLASARRTRSLSAPSTKRADDPRYIGNKGIGWKSVFKITPRPQVHSRGFRLAFDATDASGLGYIVPRPAEPLTGWDGRGTVVVLPLEAGGGAALRELRVALSDLRPSLLLFLRQLRSLEVRDAALGLHRRTTRRQHATDPGRVLLEGRQL